MDKLLAKILEAREILEVQFSEAYEAWCKSGNEGGVPDEINMLQVEIYELAATELRLAAIKRKLEEPHMCTRCEASEIQDDDPNT